MGRLTEAIALMNIEKLPSGDELRILVSNLTIDNSFKSHRRKYRNERKKNYETKRAK